MVNQNTLAYFKGPKKKIICTTDDAWVDLLGPPRQKKYENENGPCCAFGYLSLFRNPIDFATGSQR